MRIAAWNVNSINARKDRLEPFLSRTRPDVLAIQELKCVDEKVPVEYLKELGYHTEAIGQKTYNGVAILSRQKPDAVIKGFDDGYDADNARLIACQFGDVHVVCVYCPNGQAVGSEKYEYKLEWFKNLDKFMRSHYSPKDKVVLLGDFNIAPDDRDIHDPKKWEDDILCSKAERDSLQRLLDFGLHDTYRSLHQEGGVFSWWDFRTQSFAVNRGLRIDLVLATKPLLDRCEEAWIDREARKGESQKVKPSDHAPVFAEFTAAETH